VFLYGLHKAKAVCRLVYISQNIHHSGAEEVRKLLTELVFGFVQYVTKTICWISTQRCNLVLFHWKTCTIPTLMG